MASEKHHNFAILVAATLLAAFGQFFFKFSLSDPQYFILLFVVGIVAYLASTIFYFYVLSRAHLSWTYGIGGLSYIFTVLLAFLVLHENVPLARWVGVGIITVGVALVGLS